MTSMGLVIEDLNSTYDGDKWALKDINVSVDEGKTLAVLGPSGCGKSTLLKLVSGSLKPTNGSIKLGSTTLSTPNHSVPAEKRRVGMVFQDYALWPHMTVQQIIGYGLRYGPSRLDAGNRDKRVAELIELLHLEGLEERKPGELSGGQQQRVSIARALAPNPELLLFDEPLSNLDAQLRESMREELSELFNQIAATVLYVTHDVSEALALADEILVLHDGRLVQISTPEEFFNHPASGWVANIAGYSSRIEVDALRQGKDNLIIAEAARYTICGTWCGPSETGTKERSAQVAYIHPQYVHLSASDLGIGGKVRTSLFEGHHYRIRVDVPRLGTITTKSSTDVPIGSSVSLDIDPDGVALFGEMGN